MSCCSRWSTHINTLESLSRLFYCQCWTFYSHWCENSHWLKCVQRCYHHYPSQSSQQSPSCSSPAPRFHWSLQWLHRMQPQRRCSRRRWRLRFLPVLMSPQIQSLTWSTGRHFSTHHSKQEHSDRPLLQPPITEHGEVTPALFSWVCLYY